jgi:hypothetical protein
MGWDESSWLDGMLHDGKGPVRLVARDFELDPDATHGNELAFFRRNRQTATVLLCRVHSIPRTRANPNLADMFLGA